MNARRRREDGAVTAEVALLLPMLMAIVVFGCWVAGVVVGNIRCLDAARDVARAVARGDSPQDARAIGERVAPTGARITITRAGDDVQVVVRVDQKSDWAVFRRLPAVPTEQRATIQAEEAP